MSLLSVDEVARNDPDTHAVTSLLKDAAYLGEALKGNTFITDITLVLREWEKDNAIEPESHAQILAYIRHSRIFKFLQLDVISGTLDSNVQEDLVKLYIEALQAGGTVQTLNLELLPPVSSMDAFLRQTATLTNLYIGATGWDTPTQLETLQSAFSANRSIEILTLGRLCNTKVVTAILLGVASHPTLARLCLSNGKKADDAQIDALSELLRSTPVLVELQMECYRFKVGHMESFASGLLANQTVEKIRMYDWRLLDTETCKVFTKLMQTKKPKHVLRELQLWKIESEPWTVSQEEYFGNVTFRDTNFEVIANSMFTTNAEDSKAEMTVGSALEVLVLEAAEYSDVWKALDSQASTVRVMDLTCFACDRVDWDIIFRCLPKLTILHTLTLRDTDREADPRQFVRALRRNGSLREVELGDIRWNTGRIEKMFPERYMKKVGVYTERNRRLPELVAKPRLLESKKAEKDGLTNTRLFPKLFCSASHAPLTAPKIVLSGLLALVEEAGPHRPLKRKSIDKKAASTSKRRK